MGERGMRDSQRFDCISYLLEEIFKTHAKLRRGKVTGKWRWESTRARKQDEHIINEREGRENA